MPFDAGTITIVTIGLANIGGMIKILTTVVGPRGKNGRAAQPPARPHEEFILPHSLKLKAHDEQIAAVKEAAEKLEKENRADHDKIFDKIDDVRDLIIQQGKGGWSK